MPASRAEPSPPPGRETAAGMHALSLVFALVHAAAAAFTAFVVIEVWIQAVLVSILIDHLLQLVAGALSGAIGEVAYWVLLATVALSLLRALTECGRSIGRFRRREAELHAAPRLRLFLCIGVGCIAFHIFLISAPEGLSGPFRVRYPVIADILGAGAYLVAASWARRVERRGPRSRGRLGRALGVGFTNAALALVGLEIVLRLASGWLALPILVTDESSPQLRRDSERKPPGQLRFGFPMNSGGHYDSEFVHRSELDHPLVVSIGDSFSYGVVPHAYHFTTVAERERPGLEIYNMGYPGIGPFDYAYLLETAAIPLDPDLVVIQLFLGNDPGAGIRRPDPPRWHDADRYRVGVVWHRLRILARSNEGDWTREPAEEATDPEAVALRHPWVADPELEQPSFSREIYLQLELQRALEVAVDSAFIYDPFRSSLADLTRAAYDIPIVFVLIPDEFQVEDGLWSELLELASRPLDRDLPQRKTAEWLDLHGVPYLDLLPILRAVEPLEDGDRHLYHARDTHFNARGNAVAGRALAAFVEERLDTAPSRPPLPLRLDDRDEDARPLLRSGWQIPEPTHIWSDGPESVLLLPVGNDVDLRLSFDCLPHNDTADRPQSVAISLNGTELREIELAQGRAKYSVRLPRSALRSRRNMLRLRYAHTVRPSDIGDSPDDRELAVAWFALQIDEDPSGAH